MLAPSRFAAVALALAFTCGSATTLAQPREAQAEPPAWQEGQPVPRGFRAEWRPNVTLIVYGLVIAAAGVAMNRYAWRSLDDAHADEIGPLIILGSGGLSMAGGGVAMAGVGLAGGKHLVRRDLAPRPRAAQLVPWTTGASGGLAVVGSF